MALSVILVDDSKVVRSLLKRLLAQVIPDQEPVILEAGNGAEGLELFRNNEPDLGFLDLTMPDMTGYEVLETLQKEGISRKIFVLSADIQPEAERRVRRLGAAGFLPKPLKEGQLEAVLREIEVL